jgi:hypothetical protein
MAAAFPPRELDIRQFQGEVVARAFRAGDLQPARWRSAYFELQPAPEQRLVSLAAPEGGLFHRFPDERMLAAGARVSAGARVAESRWVREYDSYYYDRHGARPLPVLRLELDDAERTLLYLDPWAGAVVLNHGRLSRAERWLYNGLHSLDFPGLYNRRPLWDVVVVLLSLGGLVLSVTTVMPALRRLRRQARRRAREVW